jgi:hypothetical protein
VGDGDKRHVAIIAMLTRSSAILGLASFWLMDWNPKSCFHCPNKSDDQVLRGPNYWEAKVRERRIVLYARKDPMKGLFEIFHAS